MKIREARTRSRDGILFELPLHLPQREKGPFYLSRNYEIVEDTVAIATVRY